MPPKGIKRPAACLPVAASKKLKTTAGAIDLPPAKPVGKAVPDARKTASLTDGLRLGKTDVVMPTVGFGTYRMKGTEATRCVKDALHAGYRLIDTAQVYENEADVGAAIRTSGVPRDKCFIETKVWRSSHGFEKTIKACHQSLRKLGTPYIDLYVIHWPGPKTGWPLARGVTAPKDWTPKMRDEGTWRAMEQLYQEGKVRALGVTNYSIRHLKALLKTCKVRPMVNQVEFHPLLVQTELIEFCKKEGIVLQAYASLGSTDGGQGARDELFNLPPVQAAAKAHKRSPAQVLLRWALEKGACVVPKSTKAHRLAENADIFKFSLTKKEVTAIDNLNKNKRFAWKGLDPDTIK
eukprot:TRINITY_DN75273_c0_g1_i1.p1 TRINITY_DN75273_c0_g1~~TRINITY_DN75273_c0_g1_i1.p1  ORF type:complete len:350 (-),score=78.39 TRINITY_DN75273_c0_g1_i1:154-1203(-)